MLVIARSQEPLQKLKEQYGSQVEYMTGDLADLSIAKKAVDKALASFGRLDGLVLNHGILGQVGKIAEADPQQWKHGFDVNFTSLVAFVSGLPLEGSRHAEISNQGSPGASRYPFASPVEGKNCVHVLRSFHFSIQGMGSIRCYESCYEPSCFDTGCGRT